MSRETAQFRKPFIAFCLLAPQLLITLIFFIWPAGEAVWGSFHQGDAFGLTSHFSWLANYQDLFSDPYYLKSIWVTFVFSISVSILTLALGMLMAVMANRVVRGATTYKTLLIWPYAVAPAVAGILWRFLFNPAVGVLAYSLDKFGIDWNYMLHAKQAMWLVIIAAVWQQFSYNFLFFLAGLQAIPKSLLEAAAIDGAGPKRRFFSIVFPLLSPTTFFLLIINMIYAFFDTFGIIQVVTQGGPYDSTNILVYKVYNDGFVGLDLGGSAAQSVVLMVIVIALTVIQFRYIERKVHYQ
jgi:sn-glycerol 3-phosphate transport system permease protein